MRNLINVIEEMISVVPIDENNIILYLTDIKESQKFRAPEDMIG